MTDRDKAQRELEALQEATTTFYNSPAGKTQLDWLEQFETNLVSGAITAPDPTTKLSCLDQAKGVRAFRAYLETLIVEPDKD